MFAVIKTGGKQYRVQQGDVLRVEKLAAEASLALQNERLTLARELHDVAGHKLTAMKLNLRALAGDPAQ